MLIVTVRGILNQKMKNAKKIFITTREHEIFIVRRGAEKTLIGFCKDCQTEVEMLSLDCAVTLSGKGTRELIRQTESGAIHSIETESGHLLICRRSLKDFCEEKLI